MPIQIDSMQSQVEILPSPDRGMAPPVGGQPGTPGSAPTQGTEQLKEFLRPLVMELFGEELEAYMRMRG